MFKFEKFSLNTTRPLPLPNGTLSQKNGYYIEWEGFKAELAPIYSLTDEDLDECLNEIKSYETHFENLEDKFNLEQPFFGQNIPIPKNTSVLFCLESLLLQNRFHNIIPNVKVNSMGTLESLSEINKGELEKMICLKFKFGKFDPTRERDFLLELPKHIKLRIDANQSLEKPIPSFFSKLNIEYLEEPFRNIDSYKDLTVPFALDENRNNWNEVQNSKLIAIVTKPSIENSLSGTYSLAKEANHKGIKTIVSSAYETPIGLNTLFLFAQILDNKYSPTHHGLDGMDWYKTD